LVTSFGDEIMGLVLYCPTKDEREYVDDVIAREARQANEKAEREEAERGFIALRSVARGR
jgi:hypothetical protein